MPLVTSTSPCKRVKKNGAPCTHHALKWSEFCWQHQPREVWIPNVVTMIVGVLLGLLISVAMNGISQFADRGSVNLERGRTIPMIRRFPVILSTSGMREVVAGPGYHPPRVKGCPFSVMIEPDRTIRMYGEIRDRSGIIAVQADGDLVRALPGGGYDINSDHKAIEVVDEKKMSVFQLRMRARAEWDESFSETLDRVPREVIGARTRDKGWEMLSSLLQETTPMRPQADQGPVAREWAQMLERQEALLKQAQEVFELNYVTAKDGTWFVATPHLSKECQDLKEVESLRANIERIFEYPGHKYPGKRVPAKVGTATR